MIRFPNRQEAGRKLAIALEAYAEERPIILALPRGGVPVAYEIARALRAPLDVWGVRKLGVPWYPELGVGAISENGQVHISHEILAHVGLSEDQLQQMIEQQRAGLEERVRRFRGSRPHLELRDRTVILVDDGIATGSTVRAAIHSIRAEEPKRIVLAVPVAGADTIEALAAEVNHVVSLVAPSRPLCHRPLVRGLPTDFRRRSGASSRQRAGGADRKRACRGIVRRKSRLIPSKNR